MDINIVHWDVEDGNVDFDERGEREHTPSETPHGGRNFNNSENWNNSGKLKQSVKKPLSREQGWR